MDAIKPDWKLTPELLKSLYQDGGIKELRARYGPPTDEPEPPVSACTLRIPNEQLVKAA